jgi:hypothetical protein
MGYQVCDNIGNIQCPGGIGNGGEPILELNPETPDILEPGVYYASLEGLMARLLNLFLIFFLLMQKSIILAVI